MAMMMMVMAAAAHSLLQILGVGELAALRGVREVCRKLAEPARGCRVSVRRSGLSGILQRGGDLLCNLLIQAC
jgi:hypothetical protein